jgi:DNA invertase Pin-like site-specific DNA recombinase
MALISKAELVELQKTLGTDEAIGKKFKVCRQAIHYYRTKYGIESNWARNPERNKQIISLYRSGNSGTQIAKKVGLSVAMTYRIIGEQYSKKK